MIHERRHGTRRRGATKQLTDLRICGRPGASQRTPQLPRRARGIKLRRAVGDHAHCSARTKCRNECAADGCGVINHEQRCARRDGVQRNLAWRSIKRHRRHDDVSAAHCIINR